jgi:hypothetical protein
MPQIVIQTGGKAVNRPIQVSQYWFRILPTDGVNKVPTLGNSVIMRHAADDDAQP